MSYVENQTFFDEFRSTMSVFKDKHKELLDEVNKLGEETKENRNTLNNIHSHIEDIETKMSRPKIGGFDLERAESEDLYTRAFMKYVRDYDKTDLVNVMNTPEVRANFPLFNETIGPMGGYVVPPTIANYINSTALAYSPMREESTQVTMPSNQYIIPVMQQPQDFLTGALMPGAFQTAWGSELQSINQTNTPLIEQKTLIACDLHALPFATQDFLDDALFDTASYMMRGVAESMGYTEGDALLNGNTPEKPLGLMNFAAQMQAVQTAGTTNTLGTSADFLIEMTEVLPEPLRINAKFYMHQQTLRICRELVDGQGQYLLTETYGNTLYNGRPNNILGYPYRLMINMPAPATYSGNTFASDNPPIIFGDMRSAYFVGNPPVGLTFQRDPFSAKPYVQFWFRQRVAGNAIKPYVLVKAVKAA